MSPWTLPLADFWLAVLNHLWQSTLVLAVLWGLDRAGRRRAPAAARADLWTLGLAKLCVPAALGGAATTALAGLLPAAAEPVARVVTGVLTPVPSPGGGLAPWWDPVLTLVTGVWLVGALIALFRLVRDLRCQSRLAIGARAVTEPDLRESAATAGVPRERILVAPRVELPLVQGWWRPRILIPPGLDSVLSPAELEALLRHEECHRRRRDPLRLLAGRIAGLFLWFYPPLPWLLRRLHACSEYACDEAALAGDVTAATYARALAHAVRRGLGAPSPVAAASGGGPQLMRRRLARLGRKEELSMKLGHLILTTAAALVIAAVLVPFDVVADPPQPTPPPSKSEDQVVISPTLEKYVPPEYPASVREKGAEGIVTVKVLVGADGAAERIELSSVTTGYPELDEAALAAAKQCEFTAGTVDGEPAAMWTQLPFRFTLH